MTEVVGRYAITDERKRILSGLLDYREALAALGMGLGFQWLAGSFVEDVEKTRGRSPKDIDVVTFLPILGDASVLQSIMDAHPWIVDPRACYLKFKVDAYLINLMNPSHLIVSDTTYWHGLFSHQRVTSLWKGILLVSLPSDDAEARKLLNSVGEAEDSSEAAGGDDAEAT